MAASTLEHCLQPSHAQDTNEPEDPCQSAFLTQYDPFHDFTYAVDPPGVRGSGSDSSPPGGSPTGGRGPDSVPGEGVDLRALAQAAVSTTKIDYQDFAPTLVGFEDANIRCLESIDTLNPVGTGPVDGDLLERANAWLRQNPLVSVRTCEMLTLSYTTLMEVGDTETVVIQRCPCPYPEATDTYYLLVLRLWVEPCGVPCSPQVVLRCRDYKARQGELLVHLVKRINNNLEEDPIAGDIISTDTVLVPSFLSWDTRRLYWRESPCTLQGKYNLFVRIFYIEGQPRLLSIGIKNIVPRVVQSSFEPFSAIMSQASRWISNETHIQVTNLKSIHVSRENQDSIFQCADRCSHHFREFASQHYFQILRVFYVQTPTTSKSHHVINCMTFTPVQTTLGPNISAEFEKMRHTLIRISSWLDLAGACIHSVETVITPVSQDYPNHTLPELTFWSPATLSPDSPSKRFLLHIRLYIDGDFEEPDPRLLPPLPYSLTAALKTNLQQREVRKYFAQRRQRRRRRRIIIFVTILIIVTAGGVILLDQAFDFFGI